MPSQVEGNLLELSPPTHEKYMIIIHTPSYYISYSFFCQVVYIIRFNLAKHKCIHNTYMEMDPSRLLKNFSHLKKEVPANSVTPSLAPSSPIFKRTFRFT